MTEASSVLDDAFDVENEEGTPPIELLPKGKYTAEIIEASAKLTKAGNAKMVNLKWAITEGEFEARLVFQSIIIRHDDSTEAQLWGRRKFKDVCAACGITGRVTDLEVLLYKSCTICIGIEHDKGGQYPDKNKISRVLPLVAGPRPGKPEEVGLNDAIPF
jgi:Protein of unknown function (DUF669)